MNFPRTVERNEAEQNFYSAIDAVNRAQLSREFYSHQLKELDQELQDFNYRQKLLSVPRWPFNEIID